MSAVSAVVGTSQRSCDRLNPWQPPRKGVILQASHRASPAEDEDRLPLPVVGNRKAEGVKSEVERDRYGRET